MDITQEIRDFRRNMGKTQKEIGELLGIPQTTWASYEAGKSNPPLKVLVKLVEMGFTIKGLTENLVHDKDTSYDLTTQPEAYTVFKYNRPVPMSVPASAKDDPTAMVMLPFFNQKAQAGAGEEPTQLGEVCAFMPVSVSILRGALPSNCGIVEVKGDSMTDIGLYSGDLAIFNMKHIDGEGLYVISVNGLTRIKRLENCPIEKKIIISSENAKRYPTPEELTYEQAEEMLIIHGKVIGWVHRHLY